MLTPIGAVTIRSCYARYCGQPRIAAATRPIPSAAGSSGSDAACSDCTNSLMRYARARVLTSVERAVECG
jgi:hypothetical protein